MIKVVLLRHLATKPWECRNLRLLFKFVVIDFDLRRIDLKMSFSSDCGYFQPQTIKNMSKVTFMRLFILISCFEAMKMFEFAVAVQIRRYRLESTWYRSNNVVFKWLWLFSSSTNQKNIKSYIDESFWFYFGFEAMKTLKFAVPVQLRRYRLGFTSYRSGDVIFK